MTSEVVGRYTNKQSLGCTLPMELQVNFIAFHSGFAARPRRMIARASGIAALVGLILSTPTLATAQDLTGAGSTFANPLYQRWSADFAAKTGIKVNVVFARDGSGAWRRPALSVATPPSSIPSAWART